MIVATYVPPWVLVAVIAAVIWIAVGVLEYRERRRERAANPEKEQR